MGSLNITGVLGKVVARTGLEILKVTKVLIGVGFTGGTGMGNVQWWEAYSGV